MKRLKLENIEREDIGRYQTEFRTTNNNGVFKLRYHIHLGKVGKIKCEYCGPGRGCNKTGKHKWYHIEEKNEDFHLEGRLFWKSRSRYPNWKLVSKNKKQWMKKSLRCVQGIRSVEIKW